MLLLQDDVCVSTSMFLFLDSAKEASHENNLSLCYTGARCSPSVHTLLNKLF